MDRHIMSHYLSHDVSTCQIKNYPFWDRVFVYYNPGPAGVEPYTLGLSLTLRYQHDVFEQFPGPHTTRE